MNPVQFKVSSVENTVKKEVEGMTVFNTEQVNTKKQPMFFGKPLGVQRYDSYKYGWKTSYYQNTNDLKSDEVEEEKSDLNNLLNELEQAEEGECESCAV